MGSETGRDTAAEVERRRNGAQAGAAEQRDRLAQVRAARARLEAHDARVREHEQAIAAAKQVVANHQVALKGSGKARETLVDQAKKADKTLEKAARRARRADAAYDRAVLADLVEQAKKADQRAHATTATGAGAPSPDQGPKLTRERTSTGVKVSVSPR